MEVPNNESSEQDLSNAEGLQQLNGGEVLEAEHEQQNNDGLGNETLQNGEPVKIKLDIAWSGTIGNETDPYLGFIELSENSTLDEARKRIYEEFDDPPQDFRFLEGRAPISLKQERDIPVSRFLPGPAFIRVFISHRVGASPLAHVDYGYLSQQTDADGNVQHGSPPMAGSSSDYVSAQPSQALVVPTELAIVDRDTREVLHRIPIYQPAAALPFQFVAEHHVVGFQLNNSPNAPVLFPRRDALSLVSHVVEPEQLMKITNNAKRFLAKRRLSDQHWQAAQEAASSCNLTATWMNFSNKGKQIFLVTIPEAEAIWKKIGQGLGTRAKRASRGEPQMLQIEGAEETEMDGTPAKRMRMGMPQLGMPLSPQSLQSQAQSQMTQQQMTHQQMAQQQMAQQQMAQQQMTQPQLQQMAPPMTQQSQHLQAQQMITQPQNQ